MEKTADAQRMACLPVCPEPGVPCNRAKPRSQRNDPELECHLQVLGRTAEKAETTDRTLSHRRQQTKLALMGLRPPGPATTGKEAKIQDSIKRPGDTEAGAAAQAVGRVPVAVRGAEVPRPVAPGTSPQNAGGTIPRCPRTTVRRRTRIAAVHAVLHPLPHIPKHVMQAKPVGVECSRRRRMHMAIPAIVDPHPA